MGLIDVNKIPYLHLDLENKVRFDDVNIAFKDDIDNMPTVDAIPVEWIEKYANRYIDLENRNYFAYRGFSDTGKAILYMLEEWEKENDNFER